MSFNNKFDLLVREFCDKVASTFNINSDEVYRLWDSAASPSSKATSPVKSKAEPTKAASSSSASAAGNDDTEITREKILSANKDMLIAMCKKQGVKVTGKKDELIQRLVDSLSAEKKEKKVEPPKKNSDPPVVKAVKDRMAELAIRKNKFGNFEHTQTSLVFNTDKMVFGRQLEDGKISELTADDIELCKKYKFPYKIPENLNTSKTLDDVKIEDIDEEVLDDDDLADDIEEEEDEEILEDE
jgi:hypothetical protein